MSMRYLVQFSILILLFILLSPGSSFAQQRKRIEVKRANSMRNLKKDGKEIRRIIGNVLIFHDGITLECDSAYEYSGTQQFDAFGSIVISQQGIKLYGDVLYYDGATRTGKVRGKIVKMIDNQTVLTTRFLDFNSSSGTAYFYDGGIITNEDSKLYSDRGKYFSKNKQYFFGGNVSLASPDLLINTDSLEFNSSENIARFYGPTRLFNKDGYVYCEKGWYDRSRKQADFNMNAFIDYGAQKLYGDKIFYDQQTGFAHSLGNVVIIDSAQNTTIYGGEAKYWEETQDAMVTLDPLLIMVSDQGDSLYLRSDKFTVKSLPNPSMPDSTHKQFRGIGNVKFFRNDFQGVCDSMLLNTVDSMLHMYINPIIWNQENQLSADNISGLYKFNRIHRMYFNGSAFIISQEDSTRFNQVKGKQMEAFFKEGKLSKLDVQGNGQTIYFVRDKGQIVAVNRAESVNLSILVKNSMVTGILFRSKPTSTLFPIDKAQFEDITLVGFKWKADLRPKSIFDIKPVALNTKFYKPIESKALFYKSQKKYPAESL